MTLRRLVTVSWVLLTPAEQNIAHNRQVISAIPLCSPTEAHTGAAAVFVDQLDASVLKGTADGEIISGGKRNTFLCDLRDELYSRPEPTHEQDLLHSIEEEHGPGPNLRT